MDLTAFFDKMIKLIVAYQTQYAQIGTLTAANAALQLQVTELQGKVTADDATIATDTAAAEALTAKIAELQAALNGVTVPTDPTVPVTPPDVPPSIPAADVPVAFR